MQIEPRRVQLMLDLTGSTYRRRFVKLLEENCSIAHS
jgi:hypothetical protein